MSKEYIRDRVAGKEKKLAKYRRMCQAISSNQFDSKIDLSSIGNKLDKITDYKGKIDGNEGYHYLSTFKSKLEEHEKVLKEYKTFIEDANSAYMNMYSSLQSKITELEADIASDKSEYNSSLDWTEFYKYMW